MAKSRFVVQDGNGHWLGVIADEFYCYDSGLFFYVPKDDSGLREVVLALAAGHWAILAEVPESAEWPDGLNVIYGGDEPFDAPPQEREKEK